jgi:hypothetical protein
MNEILQLTELDFSYMFLSVFIILTGMKAIISLFEWMVRKIGLETKWMRKKREDHELLIRTSQSLSSLQEKHERDVERSDRRDEEISSDIKKLTRMFVDKEIDDMRWEINNFATNVSEGKPCNKDSFTHCIHIFEKYEKILEENGLENGEVELSMELINDAYKKKMTEGFL